MTTKKIIVYILIVLVVLGVGLFGYNKLKNKTPEAVNPSETSGMILFYGDTCPHCKVLDEWIEENKIKEKIEFSNLEVFNNQENQKLLIDKATVCEIATDSIGVPFLWTGSDCVVGDEPIKLFFQEKLNLNKNEE